MLLNYPARSVSIKHVPKITYKTRCDWETQMPPIMADSKDGQGHKDKYLDTSVVT